MKNHTDSGNPDDQPRKQFYSLRELAKILEITDRTMRELLRTSQVKGVKIGGQWRIPIEELERLKESGSQPSRDAAYDA
jgi:excisionase family DNA binding protein